MPSCDNICHGIGGGELLRPRGYLVRIDWITGAKYNNVNDFDRMVKEMVTILF